MERENRDLNIDLIKGIAIILMVIGHCIQFCYEPTNYENNYLYKTIYSFHMPLFMCISGYLTFSSKRKMNREWITGKAIKLLLPFFVWIFINNFFNNYSLVNHIRGILQAIIEPYHGLWFLRSLFLNYCAIYIIERVFKEKIWGDVFSLVICLLLWITMGGAFSWYFPFFMIGYLFHKHYEEKSIIKYNNIVSIGVVFLFMLLNLFWKQNEALLFLQNVKINSSVELLLVKIVKNIYIYMVPILGILSLVYVAGILKVTFLKEYLRKIGKETLPIYILHMYIINAVNTIEFGNIVINTVVAFCLGIIIPILINNFIKNYYILDLLLMGNYKKRIN